MPPALQDQEDSKETWARKGPLAAEDQKETLAAWVPRDPRGLMGSLETKDLWEKGGRLAFEVSQASKAQRAALEVEAQEDSQAPRGTWGPQGQRVPQGLQGPQGLRENQGLLGRRDHRASGGPWGLRVNQGSRDPLDSQGLQAHQEARAATKGPSPRHCYTEQREGPWGRTSPPESHPYRRLWSFDPKGAFPPACPCTVLTIP